MSALYETNLSSLKLIHKGKVRDIYEIDQDKLLLVATDRISAFDFILTEAIENKGIILNNMALFWFNKFKHIKNHLFEDENFYLDMLLNKNEIEQIKNRSMVVRKMRTLPIEVVIRGYLLGSAWREYQVKGQVSGVILPKGMRQYNAFDEPIFTPSTKAVVGHDENIDKITAVNLIMNKFNFSLTKAKNLLEEIEAEAMELYVKAGDYAYNHGIIIADTKLEFGLDENDELVLIDEIFTPDSSRFWSLQDYQNGVFSSFDKQVLRDWLENYEVNGVKWDRNSSPPKLSKEIINKTKQKYEEIFDLLVPI